jgi:lysozyme
MPTEPRARVRQRISRSGLELIKGFEGFRRRSARLPAGRFVVGYGHIRSAREGVEVSEADAEALLRYDLLPVEAAMNEWTFAPLTQNQFDALCSFAFSIGIKTFRRSDVLRRINEGAMLQAAAALEMWRRVELDGEGVIVDALVRRRAAEKALFLKPADGHVPAPSAVLRSRIDFAGYGALPRRRPEEVETPLDGAEAVAVRSAPEAPDAPEVDWSAPQAAAAAVSARLTALLDDEVLDADASDDQILGEAEVDPDEVFEDESPAGEGASDGDFLQAPPSPPEADSEEDELLYGTDVDEDFPEQPDADFPELEIASEADVIEADEDVVPAEEAPVAPVVDLNELPPFPEDSNFSAGADAAVPQPALVDDTPAEEPADDVLPQGFGQNSGALPSQGDSAALARPVEGPDNGPYIYLFLAGLALVVAAAVTFFRTPDPGAAEAGNGLGWVLGLLGILGVAGSLWFIMGREDALADESGEEDEA